MICIVQSSGRVYVCHQIVDAALSRAVPFVAHIDILAQCTSDVTCGAECRRLTVARKAVARPHPPGHILRASDYATPRSPSSQPSAPRSATPMDADCADSCSQPHPSRDHPTPPSAHRPTTTTEGSASCRVVSARGCIHIAAARPAAQQPPAPRGQSMTAVETTSTSNPHVTHSIPHTVAHTLTDMLALTHTLTPPH